MLSSAVSVMSVVFCKVSNSRARFHFVHEQNTVILIGNLKSRTLHKKQDTGHILKRTVGTLGCATFIMKIWLCVHPIFAEQTIQPLCRSKQQMADNFCPKSLHLFQKETVTETQRETERERERETVTKKERETGGT